jgi:hypothetical protein
LVALPVRPRSLVRGLHLTSRALCFYAQGWKSSPRSVLTISGCLQATRPPAVLFHMGCSDLSHIAQHSIGAWSGAQQIRSASAAACSTSYDKLRVLRQRPPCKPRRRQPSKIPCLHRPSLLSASLILALAGSCPAYAHMSPGSAQPIAEPDRGQPNVRHSDWCGHAAASALQLEDESGAAPGSREALRKRAIARRQTANDAATWAAGAAARRSLQQRELHHLQMHFEYQLDASTTQAQASYLQETLMPAAAAVLSRSLRVCWHCNVSLASLCLRARQCLHGAFSHPGQP